MQRKHITLFLATMLSVFPLLSYATPPATEQSQDFLLDTERAFYNRLLMHRDTLGLSQEQITKIKDIQKELDQKALAQQSGIDTKLRIGSTSSEDDLPSWHIGRFFQTETFQKATGPTILINPFAVPMHEAEDFIKGYDEVSQWMKKQPGFVNAKLHRSINPDAAFTFINVSQWESPELFKEAISNPEFQAMVKNWPHQGQASLYIVEKAYTFEAPSAAAESPLP
jgi:heme-degrading monooxygenase HmoA